MHLKKPNGKTEEYPVDGKSFANPLKLGSEAISTLVYDAPVALGVLRKENLIIEFANIRLLELWGKTDEVLGRPLLEALPELVNQPFPDLLKKVCDTGESYYGNETLALLNRNGRMEKCYFNFVYSPVAAENGQITGVMMVASEVTAQVEAKKDLEASEQRYRELIETADVATAIYHGKDFVIQLANDAMIRLWGKDQSVIGQKLRDALPELEGQPFIRLLNDVYYQGRTYKALEDRADLVVDGRLQSFYFNFSYIPLKNADGETYAILNMAVDVTELVQAKARLLESEQRSRMAIEASKQGTYELDLLNDEITCSPRLLEIFDLPSGLDIAHKDLVERLHPDDRLLRLKAHERAFVSGVLDYEARIITDSKAIRWAKFSGKVSFDLKGRAERIYGMVMDITVQKHEEIRKNDFIAMASHELKTPLTSVKGYLQVLKMESKKQGDHFLQTIVDRAENQANKMSKLVSDFLSLSRIETGKLSLDLQHFNLNALVDEIIAETAIITGNTCIDYRPAEVSTIKADKEKIGQVLSNFLSNAIKYSPPGSEIRVSSVQEGEYVTVSVSDMGPGISMQDCSKVFERYYRVDSERNRVINGFGIGLYISAEIIQMHKGDIWVESQEGQGATFYFRLKRN